MFLEFLGHSHVEGRRALFVAGQNDNTLLVRKGGRRFGYVVMGIDPSGESVERESLMPINEIGFSQLLDRTIRTLQQDVTADPPARSRHTAVTAGWQPGRRAERPASRLHTRH